jgi:hypothetical protein
MDATTEFKEALLNTGLFKKTPSNPDQYRCKSCPFCGDQKWHMYVLIKVSDDTPVMYHCFKCNESGVINKQWMDYFELDIKIPKQSYRKKLDIGKVSTVLNQPSCCEQDDLRMIQDYIEYRVGRIPTLEELQMFQYIGNPFRYVKEYLEPEIQSDYYLRQRCWFRLNNGNIHGRSYNQKEKMRWMRYQTKNCVGRGLYTMKEPIDLYKPINVCIAEGVMDTIGLYYHHPIGNAFHIAVLGKDYHVGIQHMLNMGIFGDSVNIKIFKDADVDVHRIKVDKNLLKLFKKVEIYQNTIASDYGVKEDQYEIVKVTKL